MSEDTGSAGCGTSEHGSEGSTASIREDHSIITVAAEPSGDDRLTTVVISSGDATDSGVHSNGGIDNLAFQTDTSVSTGESQSPPAEAVNLELVNMTPFGEKEKLQQQGNGHHTTEIPVKNGKEADSAACVTSDSMLSESYTTDPYDEYFVPVNEHRKYIRGEKLYVTKDKRQQSKWKRTVCWAIAVAVLGIAVLIAVLAAAGVILTNEEDSNALNAKLAATATTSSRPGVTTQNSKDTITDLPPPVTDAIPEQPYVPRALEGKLTIDDRQFEEALSRPDSEEFKKLAKSLEDEIKMSLFDHQMLNYGAADIQVKVLEFMPGSVVVRYRLAWNFKPGIHNARDPITRDELRERMSTYLQKNGGYLYTYHIASPSLASSFILDPCKSNNGGCSHTCSFDYNETLRPMCTCPTDMKLAPDGTTCIDASIEAPQHPASPADSVSGARHFPDVYEVHHVHGTEHTTPEEGSKPEPDADEEHDHSHHHHQHDDASPEPEPSAEPSAETEPSAEPESEHVDADHTGHSHPHHHSEEIKVEHVEENHEVPSSEPEPLDDEHSKAEPEPSGDHEHSKAEPEPSGDHEHSKAEPEPSGDHEHSKAEPEPSGDHEHSKAEPEPSVDHEHSKAEPEPSGDLENSKAEPEPSADHEHSKAEPEPSEDHEHSKAEPEPSGDHEHSKAEPEPSGDHEHSKAEPEPSGDHEHSKAEPEPSGDDEHSKAEPDPSGDDHAKPEPSGDHEHSKVEPEPSGDHEHSKPEPEGDHEHSKAELEPSGNHEHSKAEPEPSGDHEHSKAEPEPSGDHEHSKAEPEPSGDHEHSKPEGDHETSKAEPEPSGDHEHSKPEPESDGAHSNHGSENDNNEMSKKPDHVSESDLHHLHIHHVHEISEEHAKEESSETPESNFDHENSFHDSDDEYKMKKATPATLESREKPHDINIILPKQESQDKTHEPSAEPAPSTENSVTSTSQKPHVKPVLDQEYSDHREIDEDDVIGPLIMELRPRPIPEDQKEEHSTSSTPETKENESSTEIVSEKSKSNELGHEIDSDLKMAVTVVPDHMEKEHREENIMKIEPESKSNVEMEMMLERANMNLNSTEPSEHKELHPVEIVHLMPLNMTEESSAIKVNENEEMHAEKKEEMDHDSASVILPNEVEMQNTTTESSHSTESVVSSTQSVSDDEKSLKLDLLNTHYTSKDVENKTENVVESVEESDMKMMEESSSEPSSTTATAVASSVHENEPSTTLASVSTSTDNFIKEENSFVGNEGHSLFEKESVSPKSGDTTEVPFTPSPSTTHHIPSLEHSPTSEPELERPEDYDSNNDLLGPNEEEPQKPILKSPRFEDSHPEIFEVHSSTTTTEAAVKSADNSSSVHTSDNQEINDIYLKEINAVSTESQHGTVTSTAKTVDMAAPIEVHHETENEQKSPEVEHSMHDFKSNSESETKEEKTVKKDSAKETSDIFLIPDTETVTKKPEKKLYKNKPVEKDEDIFEPTKEKEDHKKMDRFGLALDVNQETTDDMPTTEVSTQQPEMDDGAGKLDVRMHDLEDKEQEAGVTELNIEQHISETDKAKEIPVTMGSAQDVETATELKTKDSMDETTEQMLLEAEMKKSEEDMASVEKESKEEKNKIEEHSNDLQKSGEISSRMDSEETMGDKKDIVTDKAEDTRTESPVIDEQKNIVDPALNTTKEKSKEEESKMMESTEKVDATTLKTPDEEPAVSENKTEDSSELDHQKQAVEAKMATHEETNNKEEEMLTKTEPVTEVVEMKSETNVEKAIETEKKDEPSQAVDEVSTSTEGTSTQRAPAPVHEEPEGAMEGPTANSADPTVLAGFSKCTAGQFQCVNGTSHSGPCVSLSAKCDSINDCSDASDEIGCIEDGCPGNFQCSNGQCLKRHLVCNGIIDCNDSSDEADCANWQCKFDELRCPSGRCIPLLWQCDGKADCENHTDEQNCQASCGNQEYMCPEKWCIPLSWRCNGHSDCAQGDDEKLCDCSIDQFRCAAGGCVAKSQVCDGEGQCPDLSDEWNCMRIHNETLSLQVRSAENEWLGVCSDDWDVSWSNAACQSLGYEAAVFTEYPSLSADEDSTERLLKLKPSSGNATLSPILGALEKATRATCSSGKMVEISCHDFTCGSPQRTGVGLEARLVGGDRAADGQWPSIALLYNAKHGAGCTASIVSPMWLLASLSCLTNKDRTLSSNQWQVYAGGAVFAPDEMSRMQNVQVRTIVAHPQARFNRFLYEQDVALVRLARPLELNGHDVGAICLTDRAIEPRQLCVTAGWGYNSRNERDGSMAQYLHYLPVPTIDLKECNSSRHYNGLISRDHVCAGFTDAERSPCDNDEGAPLMCINEAVGVWELQGVLSYHSHCGRGFHPSIFSSVSALRPWVDSTLGSHFAASPGYNVRR